MQTHLRLCIALLGALPLGARIARAQSGSGPDVTLPQFLQAPVVSLNTNAAAPLTARLQVSANEPVIVQIFAWEATHSWRFTPTWTRAASHDLPLIGFRPARQTRLAISIIDAAGNRNTWPVSIIVTTPSLPANFPPLHVTTSVPSKMEPGFTLAALRYSSASLPGSGMYCVFLDATGQVVWFYEAAAPGPYDIVRRRNGNFVFVIGNRLIREVNLYGDVVANYWAARLGMAGAPPGAVAVDCDAFHHELHELPPGEAGDFIALSTEVRTYSNYPVSELDPTQTTPSADVLGDVVVEFREDGTLVRELPLLDVLDPYRICYGSLGGLTHPVYGVPVLDWGHANSVIVDPSDDTWVISLRHQDAVVKVRRSDHSLVWIHGPHERWAAPWSSRLLTPVGARFQWSFHQHAGEMLSGGELAMFDNGTYRVTPPTPAAPVSTWYSRAVRYTIDPVALTTSQVWEFRGATPFFSGFFGDVDTLPVTGNTLITDGWRLVPGLNRTFSRLVEVRPDATKTIAWEVIVNDPTLPSPSPYNWNVYRTERHPDLYPRP